MTVVGQSTGSGDGRLLSPYSIILLGFQICLAPHVHGCDHIFIIGAILHLLMLLVVSLDNRTSALYSEEQNSFDVRVKELSMVIGHHTGSKISRKAY